MIILASKSPRRNKLLHQLINNFIIDVKEIDESLSYTLKPLEAVKDISLRKALEAKKYHPQDIIIAADTIVVYQEEIIGKPKDKNDAQRILKKLSGNTHSVITSYTIIKDEKIINKAVTSEVTFNILSDEFVNSYIENKNPLDKAGSYGIQDQDEYPLVASFTGDITNIIGLPIEALKEDLIKLKII